MPRRLIDNFLLTATVLSVQRPLGRMHAQRSLTGSEAHKRVAALLERVSLPWDAA